MSFQVSGVPELLSKLKSAFFKIRTAGAEGADKVAAHLVSEAQARAHVASGETRDSIKVLARERTEEGVSIVVGSELRKAVFEEFGTVKMEPIPFMRPGLEAVRPSALEEMAEPIRGELGG